MRTYRVGIVGCSGIAIGKASESPLFGPFAGRHVSAYAKMGCQIVAVCDIFPAAMQRFVDLWGNVWKDVRTYTNHREMLKNEELDIISVATSDDRHADIVVDAANAGVKGIFCEKPLATTIADADRMIEAIEANGVTVNVDHTRRWRPLYHEAKNLIQQGKIGDLQTIVAMLGGPRAMMFRNGTHAVDMICFFAEAQPAWVFAELEEGFENYGEYRGDGGHDPASEPAVSGYIHFGNGVRAFYNCCKRIPAGVDWELYGTKGMIRVNDIRCELWTPEGESGPLSCRLVQPPMYRYTEMESAIRELVRCMETGEKCSSDARESLKTVEIILGMLESQRRGNVRVPLPLER